MQNNITKAHQKIPEKPNKLAKPIPTIIVRMTGSIMMNIAINNITPIIPNSNKPNIFYYLFLTFVE